VAQPSALKKRLRRFAIAKAKQGYGPLFLPEHGRSTPGRSPVAYVNEYFRRRVRAPFLSPFARDYYFVTEEPFEVRESGDQYDVAFAIESFTADFAYYLSNFLTHPRYGPEKQVGFVRGEALRPYQLREIEPGRYSFRIQGVAVGRKDLFRFIRGKNRAGPPVPARAKPPYLSERIFFVMPTRPDAREVDQTEWYDFAPDKWKRKHPTIPLRDPIPVLFHRSRPHLPLAPRYDELYRDGVVKIALLFGYDEEGHLTGRDAREIWQILTAPRSRRFGKRDTGPHGYGGPGLGFSDPTGGHFRKLNLEGESVFRRGAKDGAGPVRVRYKLTRALRVGTDAPAGAVFVGRSAVPEGKVVTSGTTIERLIDAEVRLYNFDKSSKGSSSRKLIEQFVSVFKTNDVVHYDGHANYGGGFFIGDQPNDILWSSDIGDYKRSFSTDYQIFSIGACHAAGYFADLFYNELRPRKSPRNLDIVAAINETAFDDAVHQGLDFVRAMLQDVPRRNGDPPDYERIVAAMSDRNAFQAFIGVFATGMRGGGSAPPVPREAPPPQRRSGTN
jgi:hypothetical protein